MNDDKQQPIHFICKSTKEALRRTDATSVTILDELIDENSTVESFIRSIQHVILTCNKQYGNDYTLIIRDNQVIVDIMHMLQKRVYTGDNYGKDCCRDITMKQCELLGGIINNAGATIIIEKIKREW